MTSRTPRREDVAAAVAAFPSGDWSHQCHAASLALVRSGLLAPFGEPGHDYRVVRGVCAGVPGQHSWVVIGDPIGVRHAIVVDPTLWSYTQEDPGVIVTTYSRTYTKHRPKGVAVTARRRADIFDIGKPGPAISTVIPLDVKDAFARHFLDLLGPMDAAGWHTLFSRLPMTGWPAKPILTAAAAHPALAPHIPVDILGIYTDLNPDNLYW